MPEASERVRLLQARLQQSREEIFAIARQMKGEEEEQALLGAPGDFPHSRLMRALLGPQGRLLLGGAVVAVTLLRPRLLWRAARLAPMLRPLILRYLLPRLLGQR